MAKKVQQLDRVVIRFAGDSGDGMQLTGDRFTSETAQLGNDISTLPNFPAEIRAPAGTLPGVSSFQVHFADFDILTPGDSPDVLVAMNPAALKANLADLPGGAQIIGNTALALGIVAARVRSELPVVLGAYPITPASDILHELSKHKKFGVTTVQAEDEIAAIGVALGAAYGGALGITSTSGPGVALKGETISIAVALALPR